MPYLRAAGLADVPPGQAKVVRIGDEDLALCNVGGQIYAIANCCTHDGGPLGNRPLDGNEVECPRHGARFDVTTGAVRRLPAIVPVPTYEVKVEGDDIFVNVD